MMTPPAPRRVKESVKTLLRSNAVAYKAAEVFYENSLYLRHIINQGLTGVLLGERENVPSVDQSLLTWRVDLRPWTTAEELATELRSHGLTVLEGGHTIYVPPQNGLRELIPDVVDAYPAGSGFKILKDCRHPLAARYLYKHRSSLKFLTRLIGTPRQQLASANFMYSVGIGPRVWDLTCWQAQNALCTVFVVDNVTGITPTQDQFDSFIRHLNDLNSYSRLRVLIPHWQENDDFGPPDCNGNLVYSTVLGKTQYVDFQNFGLTRPAVSNRKGAARHRLTRSKVAAPETESAARNAEWASRWQAITDELQRHSVSLAGRLVVDATCADGATIAESLGAGATWAVGHCHASDGRSIQNGLLMGGATRFSILHHVEARAGDGSMREVPLSVRHSVDESIVFLRHGATEPPSDFLFDTPWRAAVLETDATSLQRVMQTLSSFPPPGYMAATVGGGGAGGHQLTIVIRGANPATRFERRPRSGRQ